MASNRIGRINEEIQRELSSLFRTLKDPRVQGGMVTITHVDTTTDLRYCRVFVSVLDKTQEKDVIRGLKSAAGYLRRARRRRAPRGLRLRVPRPARGSEGGDPRRRAGRGGGVKSNSALRRDA